MNTYPNIFQQTCWEDTMTVVLKSLYCIPRLKATSELMVSSHFAITPLTIESVATMGEAASYFDIYSLCKLPSMQCQLFYFPSHFYLKNISDNKALTFSNLESFVETLGRQVSMTCSCVNLVIAASSAHAPNLCMPALK